MKRIHTHYDNLKVDRNASPEEIRTAYKRLSRKYHPDRNPGNPEAERIMAIINSSYSVLSDPERRREHDRWMAQQEALEQRGKWSRVRGKGRLLSKWRPLRTIRAAIARLVKWLLRRSGR